MSDAVDVSVMVATRNRAPLLPDCLRSLTAQKCPVQFEVIVVDNGSEDATPQVLAEWSRRDERIRAVEQPEVGLSRAKNAGIRSARGELVLFTDDDVVVSDAWIAAYVDFFTRRRSAPVLAGGPVLPIPHDLSEWPRWLRAEALADLPCRYFGPDEHTLRDLEWLWGANMGGRREFLQEIGGFDEELGLVGESCDGYEDVEIADRIRADGGDVWYCPTAVVFHRVDPSDARPRSVLQLAFLRGANDVLRARRHSYIEPAFPVPEGRVAAGVALPWLFASWVLWTGAFRLARGPTTYELARRSAWGAGWCTAASAGGRSDWTPRALRRVARLGQRVALRLTPC